MPTWTLPAERTTADSTIVADLNKIRDIIQLLGGNGTSQPSSDIETLKAAVDLAENIPVGVSLSYDGIDIPDNYLAEDGSSLSRTTYATLYAAITKSKGSVTFTNGTDLCNLNGHLLSTGDCVEYTNTGGALPPELTANTNYFVIYNDANSFKLATTLANAIAGTAINLSGDGTGTHTLRHCPWGIDGASNFLLPDKRGVGEEGKGTQGTAAWASANYLGGLGQYKQDELQYHWHTMYQASGVGQNGITIAVGANGATPDTSNIPGSAAGPLLTDGVHGTPRGSYITNGPRVGVNKIIRYQ
jgi:hypothetical protein